MKKFAIAVAAILLCAVGATAVNTCTPGTPKVYGSLTIDTMTVDFGNDVGKYVRCVAYFDDKSPNRDSTISVPDTEYVEHIIYHRDFSGNTYGTVMFPFESTLFGGDGLQLFGANVYKFVMLKRYCPQCVVQAIVDEVKRADTLEANTPYIVKVGGVEGASQIEFRQTYENFLKVPSYPLSTKGGNNGVVVSEDEDSKGWKFVGTYSYKKWVAGDKDLGRVYGYAAEKREATDGKKEVSVGDFVKGSAGAFIRPMRAYFCNNCATGKFVGMKAAAKPEETASLDEGLPEKIEIVIRGSDGDLTPIGVMNTRTGEISTDDNLWFDMKGRKLNKKPTAKGTYYNKGQKVVIK
ncbi:hypothetical protein SAMN05720766_1102 [Fibrobacter sp. UWH9]|uniref:hypothetical protein n=1 Tax=Fibrobacter sp. UWH9 TaxID=1896213 RepID=UPI000910D90B|nr:hypothetical protein [Fibrobacter sp. UWH9]MDO4948501.1 hypothetical protein [Fibrobacter sp.]SHH30506.1 hypothetical protein SAMN05720766_1102 [Fibrobacter sp. UWH9]